MDKIGEKLDKVEKQLEEHSYAMDLLTEFKKTNKRMFVIILMLIAVLVASNFYWAFTFTQYDFVSYEIVSEDGGNANYIGNDGDIHNGEGQSEKEN